METLSDVRDRYFEWIVELMCAGRFAEPISYRKLLLYLHSTPFTYSIPRDKNRAEDGRELRWRYALYCNYGQISRDIRGPCSVLEMMVGLALRCEETIMDDPDFGDRTTQWFWRMITNLGLGGMDDESFDRDYVQKRIDIFLNRKYDYYGHGGLFVVKNPDEDMRNVEIWYQLSWYLDELE